jgi:hypothetical protein
LYGHCPDCCAVAYNPEHAFGISGLLRMAYFLLVDLLAPARPCSWAAHVGSRYVDVE